MTRDRKTRELTVRMPRELHERAVAAAEADDRTLASLIRQACRWYVRTEPDIGR